MRRARTIVVLVLAAGLWIGARAGNAPGGLSDAEKVMRDPLGHVLLLRGRLTGASNEDPSAVARRFFDAHAREFGARAGTRFRLRTAAPCPSGTRVVFSVHLSGIPVINAEAAAVVRPDGGIDLAAAEGLAGRIRMDRPKVAMSTAASAWRLFMRARAGRAELASSTRLVYVSEGSELRLTWETRVAADDGTWQFLTSAETAGELTRVRRLALDEVTGTGRVYSENPKKTPSPLTVSLEHLNSTHTLAGTYARTFNANGTETFTSGSQTGKYSTASSSSNSYIYDRTDKRFAEVMGYYHVSAMKDYLVENNLSGALNKQIPLVVNVQDPDDPSRGYDNAFYTRDFRYRSTGMMVFGSGDVFHNLAEDSDVIYHEYGHAILDHIAANLLDHYEHVFSGAIHEGTGDAIATQLNGNSKLAEWGLSHRKGGRWEGRDVDNDNRYPEDVADPDYGQAEVHHTGLIIGGLFWEMRKRLGAEVAVALYFDALNRMRSRANFFDFRDALLQSERVLEQNANLDVISSILAERGLDGEDPGNKQAAATTTKMQTRSFDYDKFETGGVRETFAPDSWAALMAKMKVANASPGYYAIPSVDLIFPPDIGSGGYYGYLFLNEEQAGESEYLTAILYIPPQAAPATISWALRVRLGDQKKFNAVMKDSFKVE